MYAFLPIDLEGLNQRIGELTARIKDLGKQIGEGSTQGAETYHDNFVVEEAQRQLDMWQGHLSTFLRIRQQARLQLPPTNTASVAIGSVIDIVDIATGEHRVFQIGSYQTFRDTDPDRPVVSYPAPIAKPFLGTHVGDVRSVTINGRERRYMVWNITTNWGTG